MKEVRAPRSVFVLFSAYFLFRHSHLFVATRFHVCPGSLKVNFLKVGKNTQLFAHTFRHFTFQLTDQGSDRRDGKIQSCLEEAPTAAAVCAVINPKAM